MRAEVVTVALIATALAAACGSGSGQQAASTAPASAPTIAAQAATPTAAATVAGQAATPATNPLTWMAGKATAVADGKVTLQDGSSFTLDPQTSISRLTPGTAADLQPGRVVAITATRQNDNTLLASLVRILAAAPSATFFRQSPMTGGTLMTNATIADVTGNTFTITFTGGGAKVTLAPGAQVASTGTGTLADLKVGAMVYAQVRDNGVAQQISVE
jgi:hypothetical protein